MINTNKLKQDINDRFILIAPDGGSLKKIYKLAEQIGYKGDIITCNKDRDVGGNLTKIFVPVSPHYSDSLKDHIIIDDICDGGATFINIAKYLKEKYSNMNDENMKGKIYLIVTHSIFSKGFSELSKYFDGIYCTNSYSDLKFHPSINDIIGPSEKLVKQLNVF